MENKPSCSQLLQSLDEAAFFALDLNLYLDTHPDDEAALAMFREACRQYQCCKEAFEESCFPLNPCGSCAKESWDWLDGAWPPERM